ncbi:Small nuclear ribonucleoprotein-associated protein [Salix suchowensis]|nr:Small nuclear ribonucleoprotein-associated protein [Salix suchowensis]
MLGLVNWRLRVTINDGRALTGQMLAFDRHMNLVLADCEEFRRVRPKKKAGEETAPEQEMKRALGLVILRGETVVSLSVEGPPPVVDEDKKNAVCGVSPSLLNLLAENARIAAHGPGRGMPAGRGMGMMPQVFFIRHFQSHGTNHGSSSLSTSPHAVCAPGMPGPPPGFMPPGFPPGMSFPPGPQQDLADPRQACGPRYLNQTWKTAILVNEGA